MDYLPVFVATRHQHIIVVGEGQMAEAKCRGALKSAARVSLFAEQPTDAMREWQAGGQVHLMTRPVAPPDFCLLYTSDAADE